MGRYKSNFKETIEKAKKTIEGNGQRDERFWYPSHDRKKDQVYELRMMPSKPKTQNYGGLCYINEAIHTFEYLDRNGRKKYFWSPCLKRHLGEDCPICDVVSDLWNKDKDDGYIFSEKEKALRTKLSLSEKFVSNVIIIDDPEKSQNNGKVFMTKFPVKGQSVVFKDIILRQLNLSDSDKKKKNFKQINPFEPYDTDELPGCNFYFDYRAPGKSESYGNYNASEFCKTELGGVYEDESKIDEAMDKLYDLEEYLDELKEKVIPYEEVIQKIGHVLEGKDSIILERTDVSDEEINDEDLYEDDDSEETEEEKEVETDVEEEKVEEKPKSTNIDDDLDKTLEEWE